MEEADLPKEESMITANQILKTFDDDFLTNPAMQVALVSGDEKRALSAFLSLALKQMGEVVRPEPIEESTLFGAGYNDSIGELDHNLAIFFGDELSH